MPQRVRTPRPTRAALGSRILRGVIAVGSMLAIAAGVGSGVAHATEAPSPGNNGTVKVNGTPFDDLPANEPLIGCDFQVDFYGFGEGELYASVRFETAPPTFPAGEFVLLTDTVFIGEDDGSGGGSEAGPDASVLYTLDFTGIAPDPQTGFHLKLTVDAEGAQGADTKSKIFWATGCGTPTPTTTTATPTATPSTTETTTPTPSTTETTTTATTTSTTTTTTTWHPTTAPSSSTTSSSSAPVSTVTTYPLQPVNAGVTSDSGNAGSLGSGAGLLPAGLLVAGLLGLLVLVRGRHMPRMPRLKRLGSRRE